jgi:hypothetical protein
MSWAWLYDIEDGKTGQRISPVKNTGERFYRISHLECGTKSVQSDP